MRRQTAQAAEPRAVDYVGADVVPAAVPSFDDFYHREFPALTVLARALIGPEQAEDVAQESLLVAYRRWRTIASMRSPGGYVRGICAHKATSLARRRSLERRTWGRLVGRPEAVRPEDELSDDSWQFWTQIRRLPQRQAQAAALHYALDMSVAEIAEVLDCAEGTVKAHLHRARTAIAAALAPTTEETPS